eukprot:gene18837-25385_t
MAEADKAAEYVNVLSDSSRVALLSLRTRSTPTVVRYQLLKNLSGVPEPAQNRAESSGRGVVVSHPLPYTSSSSDDDSLTAHVLERQISHPRVNQAASAALKRVWPHWQTLLLFLSVATAALARAFTHYLTQWQTLLLVIPVAAVLRWYDFVWAMLCSMPRSSRVCVWTLGTGAAYRFLKKYHLDHESEEYQLALTELHTEVGRRLANVCRANGGVYVKAGQFASSFGADRAVPRSYRAIRQVLLFELGPNAESLFSSFEKTAVAAASIAQVHRARLSTGEEVAVKLQYPGLRTKVGADLFIIKCLARTATYVFPDFHLSWMYDELENSLNTEMDFRTEIANATKLAGIVKEDSIACVHVPHMYHELCSPRVVVMEWIEGTKITNVNELNRQGINPRCVGLSLLRLFAELTFVKGFVHGDPHPGNLMVRAKGKRSFLNWLFRGSHQAFELVLLDHGTSLTVQPEMRELFCQLWCSFVTRDKKMQRDVCFQLGGERAAMALPVLLTHQARTREEEQAVRAKAGFDRFSDMTAMMASVSRELVELLRINTVIRGVSSQLGINMQDRKRICAWYARQGLPPRSRQKPHIHPSFNKLRYRLELLGILSLWSTVTWTKSTAWRAWGCILDVFGEVIFE